MRNPKQELTCSFILKAGLHDMKQNVVMLSRPFISALVLLTALACNSRILASLHIVQLNESSSISEKTIDFLAFFLSFPQPFRIK